MINQKFLQSGSSQPQKSYLHGWQESLKLLDQVIREAEQGRKIHRKNK